MIFHNVAKSDVNLNLFLPAPQLRHRVDYRQIFKMLSPSNLSLPPIHIYLYPGKELAVYFCTLRMGRGPGASKIRCTSRKSRIGAPSGPPSWRANGFLERSGLQRRFWGLQREQFWPAERAFAASQDPFKETFRCHRAQNRLA